MIKTSLWRIAAIVSLLVWLIVFFAFNTFTDSASPSTLSVIDNSFLYLISVLVSFFLIFFPTKFVLYTVMCCLWGLVHISDGGSTNGYIMYALGCAFTYKEGLLFKKKFLTIVLLFLPCLAIAYQYKLGIEFIVDSIIDLIFIFVVSFLLLLLFKENLFIKVKSSDIIVAKPVDLSVLNSEELALLLEVLKNKTYHAIGIEQNKSESSIKQAMVNVYHKLGITCKKDLLELHRDKLLIIP